MITKKKLKEEIITYDIITYKDDDGKDIGRDRRKSSHRDVRQDLQIDRLKLIR